MIDLEKEWKFLNEEVFLNKPSKTPFPKHIVAARELLLKAQVLLSLYAEKKLPDIKAGIESRYKITIDSYSNLLKAAN